MSKQATELREATISLLAAVALRWFWPGGSWQIWLIVLGSIFWVVFFLIWIRSKSATPEKCESLPNGLDKNPEPVSNGQPQSQIAETTTNPRKETQTMRGTILDFSIQTNTGIISGGDGNRYSFIGAEWKDSTHPIKGMAVDFDPKETTATAIYVVSEGRGAPLVGSESKRPLEYQGFYKSTDDKVLGGVCGGLGHKWNVSPNGLRIVFVILGLVYLLGLIVYVALWIILKGVPTKNVKFDV